MTSPPHGMHTATMCLTVKDSVAAIEFYKKIFDAQELFRMAGPDGKSIMHAEVKIGDSIIMLNDEMPQMGCMSPQSVGGSSSGIYLYVNDVDATIKKASENGAKVKMPAMDAFWGDRMGNIEDPFGHNWTVATHIKDMSPEEIAKAGQEWTKSMCK
jgi:PhnB protein